MKKNKETKIMIRLSEQENKIVEVYKTLNGFKTKEEAIKDIIRRESPNLVKGLRNGL